MKKVWLAAVMIACSSIGVAQAAEQNLYVGAGLGMFEMDPGKNKKTALGGYAVAGMSFHRHFSAEVRLGSVGSTDNADFGPILERSKVDWFASVLAKPQYEVMDDVTLYGLLGVTTLKASFTAATGAKAGVKQGKSSTNLTFGLGGEYTVTPEWRVGGEWVRYSSKADVASKNSNFKGLDVNGFTATVHYAF